MKKVVFVSPNKNLIEKVSSYVYSQPDISIQLLSISGYQFAVHDIEAFGADVVIIDATNNVWFNEISSLCTRIDESNLMLCEKYILVSRKSKLLYKDMKSQESEFQNEHILFDEQWEILFQKIKM